MVDKVIDVAEETRQRILDVSRQRFAHYGYGKTTMAEIAKDCRMSAANLYRFFENKQDIAAGLAGQCFAEDEAKLRAAVSRADLSVAQRLEQFVLETLSHTYEQWSKQPKMNELVQSMSNERADLMLAHRRVKQAMLAGLLTEGDALGQFDAKEPMSLADAILHAITVFDAPFFMHLHTENDWRNIARSVALLVINGVRKR
jgi:AcrR family transcriptional regulator